MAKSRSTTSGTSTWKSKQSGTAQSRPSATVARTPIGRKGGGYKSDQTMDFGKSQSIEELTGGRIKKKA